MCVYVTLPILPAVANITFNPKCEKNMCWISPPFSHCIAPAQRVYIKYNKTGEKLNSKTDKYYHFHFDHFFSNFFPSCRFGPCVRRWIRVLIPKSIYCCHICYFSQEHLSVKRHTHIQFSHGVAPALIYITDIA